MDIRMDTYLRGTARFTGAVGRIGRRSADTRMGARNYLVTIRRDVIKILDNAGAPIMWGEIDRDRLEIKGEFTEQYGGGSWVASAKGGWAYKWIYFNTVVWTVTNIRMTGAVRMLVAVIKVD